MPSLGRSAISRRSKSASEEAGTRPGNSTHAAAPLAWRVNLAALKANLRQRAIYLVAQLYLWNGRDSMAQFVALDAIIILLAFYGRTIVDAFNRLAGAARLWAARSINQPS